MYFRNLLRIYFQEKKPLLHRWYTPQNKEYLDRKIYLANYDHCGKILLKIEKNKYIFIFFFYKISSF